MIHNYLHFCLDDFDLSVPSQIIKWITNYLRCSSTCLNWTNYPPKLVKIFLWIDFMDWCLNNIQIPFIQLKFLSSLTIKFYSDSNKIMTAFILFLLITTALAQEDSYTITFDCTSSSSGATLTFTGGPFNNNSPYPPGCQNYEASLQQATKMDVRLPLIFTISCGQVCTACGYTATYSSSSGGSGYSSSVCAGSS